VLYLSIAVAAWFVWRQSNAVVPMTLFGIQLVFNAAWSWLFFRLHNPGAVFIDMCFVSTDGRFNGCPITGAWMGTCIAVATLAIERGVFWPAYLPMATPQDNE
jgi:hypothetical protein